MKRHAHRRAGAPSAVGPAPAFTLLELLLVMVLITVLTGTLALTLRTPAGAMALQDAQHTLAGLCGTARARAALAGVNTRLIVCADPSTAADALRWCQIIEEDAADPGRWVASGGGFRLPRGIYVVPPAAVAVPGDPTWPAPRRSTALANAAEAMIVNGAVAGPCYYLQFTPRGTTGGGNLVLATGHPCENPGGFPCALENRDAVRGVLLRSSGAVTLLNDAAAFGP